MRIFSCLITLILLQACSVVHFEKRRYTKGISLSTHRVNRSESKNRSGENPNYSASNDSGILALQSDEIEETLMTSTTNNDGIKDGTVELKEFNSDVNIIHENTFTLYSHYKDDPACDTIIMNDGKIIRVNILQTTNTLVKYRQCESNDTTELILAKEEIKALQYASGKFEFIRHESSAEAHLRENNELAESKRKTNPEINSDNDISPLRLVGIVFGSIGLTILAGAGIVGSAIVFSIGTFFFGFIGVLGIYLSITIALYLFLIMINRGKKEGLFKKAALITLLGLSALAVLLLIVGVVNIF